MDIYKYKNYDEYIKNQKETTNRKFKGINDTRIYVREFIIKEICEYYKTKVKFLADSILCHGTRGGREQKFFKKYFKDAEVVGSELFEGCQDVPMTVIHDFNKVKEEWIGKFDIVYSNSFDHTITPKETLKVWSDQLTEHGRLCIEWTDDTNIRNAASDPLAASMKEITEIMNSHEFILESEVLRGKARHEGTVLVYAKK